MNNSPDSHDNVHNSAFTSAFSAPLKLYGTTVPQLSVVVAVVIGSLGFNEYFNPGAWTVVMVLSFGLVYIFRRQVSPSLPKATMVAVLLICLLLAPALAFLLFCQDPAAFVKGNVFVCSSYTSLASTIPLAIVLASYRKQEERYGLIFPEPINSAIYERLVRAPFYKSDVLFDVEVRQTDNDSVVLEILHSYLATNRTNEPHVWTAILDPDDPKMRITEVEIGGKAIHTRDPRYMTARGLEITSQIPPKTTESFRFHFRAKYHVLDSELFTTYDPATDLTVQVQHQPSALNLSFDLHHESAHTVHPQEKAGRIFIRLDRGLLPYQGVRLRWGPKGE